MADANQQLGKRGEDLAATHLRKKGYKVIERNFRTRTGEIDIIAKHKGCIVFVEVKSRQSMRYGDAKLAVTAQKQRKISMVALEYLKKNHTLETRSRFDVVTVQPSAAGPAIEVIPNAFELAYG